LFDCIGQIALKHFNDIVTVMTVPFFLQWLWWFLCVWSWL